MIVANTVLFPVFSFALGNMVIMTMSALDRWHRDFAITTCDARPDPTTLLPSRTAILLMARDQPRKKAV